MRWDVFIIARLKSILQEWQECLTRKSYKNVKNDKDDILFEKSLMVLFMPLKVFASSFLLNNLFCLEMQISDEVGISPGNVKISLIYEAKSIIKRYEHKYIIEK